MNRCLRDDTLLLVYAGEGTSAHHTHLATCRTCAGRYQRLVQEFAMIEQVLQEEPPPRTVFPRLIPLRVRWIPMAAALAAMLVLVWGSPWGRKPSSPVLSKETQREEVFRFLEKEVSPALFGTADVRATALPTPVSNSTYLQAALAGGWPCEQQEPFFTLSCEVHPFPLLIGGQ